MATRVKHSLQMNATASLEDEVFPGKVKVPKGIAVDATYYRQMLVQHLERRITCVFLQLVLVQGTREKLAIGPTGEQAKSAPPLYQWVSETEYVKLNPRNACHSSTIPHLVAPGFKYDGSSIDRFTNATLAMPKWANDADSYLDFRSAATKMHRHALDVLQRASDGAIGLEEGVQEFLGKLETALHVHHEAPLVEGVFALFRAELPRIQTVLAKESPQYDRWLDLRPEETDGIRPALHKIRMGHMRANAAAESLLMNKIDMVKEKVFKAMGRTKHPTYFHEAFQDRLLKSMAPQDCPCSTCKDTERDGWALEELEASEPVHISHAVKKKDRLCIAKLLADSGDDFAKGPPEHRLPEDRPIEKALVKEEEKARKTYLTVFGKTAELMKDHQGMFDALAAELHASLEELGQFEEMARQQTVSDLLKARKLNPKSPSFRQILEQTVPLSLAQEEILCKTLRVQANIFYPEHFYSKRS